MSNRILFGKTAVFVFIAALGALLWFLTSTEKTTPSAQQILPVKIIYPEKGDLGKILRVSGFVESETMITIFPRIGGILTEIYVEMGDPVEKDQIIGLIDSEPYDLSFNQAKVAFLVAQSTFNRVTNLYNTGNVSQQIYDEAKANYDALKSGYELAELQLSYTKLKAPVQGVVLEKHISKGSMISPQVPVVTIGDLQNLKINAGVPEIHYSFFQKHKTDMEINITVPALENSLFSGSISNIAPFIKPQSRNFVVKCQINDSEMQLRPGMFVYINFVLDKRKDIFYLPYKTLAGGDSLWFVDDMGKARQLEYLQSFGNEEYFQITSEYSSYSFIVEGQNFLSEGQSVRISGDL
jgi:membrane fusion protein, multidrug efflux system